MKPKVLFLSLVLGVVIGGLAQAVGTGAGTNIENQAEADYTANGNNRSSTSNIVTTTVGAVYGLNNFNTPAEGTVAPGATITYTYSIQNCGNSTISRSDPPVGTDSLSISLATSGEAGWSAGLYEDAAGTTPLGAITLAADDTLTFYLRVTAPGDAENGETFDTCITVSCTSDGGSYTGNNGLNYGGPDEYNHEGTPGSPTFTTTCEAPVLFLAKSAGVANPDSYGGANSNVPGATITYTIVYDNDGADAAGGLIITDWLPGVDGVSDFDPENVTFVAGSATSSPHTGATVDIDWHNGTDWVEDEPGTVVGVRWSFTGDVAVQENSEGTDTTSAADGDNPDNDAGSVSYQVTIN